MISFVQGNRAGKKGGETFLPNEAAVRQDREWGKSKGETLSSFRPSFFKQEHLRKQRRRESALTELSASSEVNSLCDDWGRNKTPEGTHCLLWDRQTTHERERSLNSHIKKELPARACA